MHSGSLMSAIRPGAIIGRRFRVVELLGEGGFGAVYKAEEVGVGRTVAVKLIHRPDGVSQAELDELKGRFEREAQALGRLHSPFIVNLIELGMHNQRVFIAMEYIRGRPLAVLLKDEGPIKPLRACAICLQILQGLAEAHAAGVIHRDLKPDNVMVEKLPLGGETVKLLDFGVARFQDAAKTDMKTQDGRVLGTPSYMAPEQGLGKVSPQSDLYALGVMLFEMLTGRLPFTGDTALELMTRKLNKPPPIEILHQAGLPPSLIGVVEAALATEDTDRYLDAKAMAEAIHAALDEATGVPAATGMESTGIFRSEEDTTGAHTRGAVVSPETSMEPVVEDPPRRGMLVLGIVGGLVAAAGAAFLVIWLNKKPEVPVTPAAPSTEAVTVDVTADNSGAEARAADLIQLLNSARVADDAGRKDDAITGFKRFLEQAPDHHPERAVTEKRLAELRGIPTP